jgi:hypothetical protein
MNTAFHAVLLYVAGFAVASAGIPARTERISYYNSKLFPVRSGGEPASGASEALILSPSD